MSQLPITLKGTPQGILLQPRSNSWAEMLQALDHALTDAGKFFQGGRVILDLGGRALAEAEFVDLRALLDRHELELWAVLNGDETTQHLIRSHGIRTRLPGEAAETARTGSEPGGDALFLQGTLRSGQSINFPGHVTLVGDVNPGAEVIAGGNIVVWGRVRGTIQAGAWGDTTAFVCALDLNPAQLRIAGYISRAPEDKRRKPQPERARVRDGYIVAEPWLST